MLINRETHITLFVIDGYTYDEESQAYSNQSENTVTGKAAVKIISADGTHTGKHGDEVKRTVKISDAAKFEKIYKYLQSDDDNALKYYEFLTDDLLIYHHSTLPFEIT